MSKNRLFSKNFRLRWAVLCVVFFKWAIKKYIPFRFALKFDILNPFEKIFSYRFEKWSFTFRGISPKNDYFSSFSKNHKKSKKSQKSQKIPKITKIPPRLEIGVAYRCNLCPQLVIHLIFCSRQLIEHLKLLLYLMYDPLNQ